ncbi:MAG: arginine--tRNA ligase, partial [Oligoflexia bacterium]|nr:arginine--tRNA ligase [Oligoflexia bacterium]
ARITSLIEKLKEKYPLDNLDNIWGALKEKSEEALVIKILNFNQTVIAATENNRPSLLCTYLYELCKLYNNFYAECSVAYAENNQIGTARLALSLCVKKVLKQGLELLGIPAPNRM